MKKMTVKFQDPFLQQAEERIDVDHKQILDYFSEIDWERLNLDSYEKHDDVIHDFYYFEVSYKDDSAFEHALNISGAYTYGEDLTKNGPRFYINYHRPVEQITKGFLGLGAERKKTVIDNVEIEECTKKFAVDCLQAFINEDKTYLKKLGTNEIQWRS